MLVAVGVVVLLTIGTYVLLELRVAVAARAFLLVVVLEDKLHVGVFAAQAFDDLWHHAVEFLLARVGG